MSNTRLLFVISNDYGELGNAAGILRGHDILLDQSMLLLPPRLFERNQTSFGCASERYGSAEDILRVLEVRRPEIVFLFSGYLLAANDLMTVESVSEIVSYSKANGIRVVTSDPFLGLLSGPLPGVMDAHESFRSIFAILGDTHHFYPVPCDHLPSSAQIRGFSTFNSNLIREDMTPGPDLFDRRPEEDTPSAGAPIWLFILSAADYGVQTAIHGQFAFGRLLATKIRDTLAAGRRPVLLAPSDCLQALVAGTPRAEAAELLPFCDFDAFTERLLDAEAAFYWNMFSHSMLHRMVNELPVFFFDRGHMGRHRVVYEAGVRNFFLGSDPVCLDQRKPLLPEVLSLVHSVSRLERSRLSTHFRKAPNPEAFLSEIAAGGV